MLNVALHQDFEPDEALLARLLHCMRVSPMVVYDPVAGDYHARTVGAPAAVHEHRGQGWILQHRQGHGVISAKIASTVHDTFHAFMLTELDRYGKTTPDLFEQLNIRLAHSLTARNALGRGDNEAAREIATMLYGEVRPSGHFRFVNFGHPSPLLFSAEQRRFIEIDRYRMVQFLPLGLEVPEDHPDRKRYHSMHFRQRPVGYADVAEITLIHPGDILFLYTDGVYDGSDDNVRHDLELVMNGCCGRPAKAICNTVLDYAVNRDVLLRDSGERDLIDDKTAFIIKRSATG